MATPNGAPSPSNPSTVPSPITGKRKRTATSQETNSSDVTSHDDPEKEQQELGEIHQLLEDIVVVLQRSVTRERLAYNAKPSQAIHLSRPSDSSFQISHKSAMTILQRPLTLGADDSHSAKRPKLSTSTTPVTVASLVSTKSYNTIDRFLRDMDSSITEAMKDLRGNIDVDSGLRGREPPEATRLKISQIQSVKEELGELILREMTFRPKAFNGVDDGGVAKGDPDERKSSEVQGMESLKKGPNKAALTLYGSAPHPRQLFSSIQQSPSVQNTALLYGTSHAPSIGSVRESALPNGITTTEIVPVHSSNSLSEKKKKVPTLGELMPRPSSLAQLNPPKQSRHTATRSSSVNWYNAAESTPSTRSYRRDNYSTQAMGTGHWLTYNIAPSASKMSSPEAKRKQRDRALSFGESQATLPQETVDAHNQAKDEALFRSAFSSFAPDRDNTGATINVRAKNRVWWERVGESRFYDTMTYVEAEASEEPELPIDTTSEQDVDREVELFEEAVASWVPEELPAELRENEQSTKEPATAQEIDDVLKEISELLETLNSHQRVRNLSLATNARTIAGQNPQLTAMSGTPSSPSSAEFDVYEMLKSQLIVMISLLPPFAVARLDGDKLAALNVSTKIQVEGKAGKGTMEEDDISLKSRQAANPAAYPRSANATSSVPARSNPYSSTPIQQSQRSNYTAQPSVSRQSSTYLPNQQYSNRPVSTSQYYGNANSSVPTQQRAPMTSDRYSYATSQQYGQQGSRSSNSGYANGYRTTTTPGGTYSQQYATPSQGSSASATYSQSQRPSQPGYQQRAMNSQAYGYVAASASAGRSTSPPQPASAYTPQQRSSYVANNPVPNSSRPQVYQAQSSQYGGQSTPAQQTNGSGLDRAASQAAYMTPNEQAALMSRQKAQLAEQQRPSPSRPTSSTPQPANGGYSGQPNGTPTPQANGVSVGQGQ